MTLSLGLEEIEEESEEEEETIEDERWRPAVQVVIETEEDDANGIDEEVNVDEDEDGYEGWRDGEYGDDREEDNWDMDGEDDRAFWCGGVDVGPQDDRAGEVPMYWEEEPEVDREELLVPVNEDDLPGNVIPPPPTILDQPFMAGFHRLSDTMEAGRTEAYELLGVGDLDVDRWELSMIPVNYLKRFSDTLATVQLVNRAPRRQLQVTYHLGPGFNRWLLLAQATHQVWIDPRFKAGFFHHLAQYQTAQPGRTLLQASTGVSMISTSVFIHCLIQVECDTVRIKAFGQKTPTTELFLRTEPAQSSHPWAVHNEWDIGKNFYSPYIWLFDSASGRKHEFTRYPMIVPGSSDYGAVNIKLTHQDKHYSIKVYPRMVHIIKSFNSGLQSTVCMLPFLCTV